MRLNRAAKLPILVIAIVGVLIVVGGIGVFTFKSKAAKKSGHEHKDPAATVALGEFVVNLADAGEVRYLKANVVLEVTGEGLGGGGHGEEGGSNARVRDAVIDVMSANRFSDLIRPGGKEKLKKDITAAVNERLQGSEVVGVYFNEFAMQ